MDSSPKEIAGDEVAPKQLTIALANLRGTFWNFIQTGLSFFVALGCTFNGAARLDTWSCRFFVVSVILMVASVLTAAKTIRDAQLADIFEKNVLSIAIRGSLGHRIQSFVVALLAVAVPFWAVLSINGTRILVNSLVDNPEEDSSNDLGYMLISLSWLFSSTLNFCKVIRDRTDASFFESNSRNFEPLEQSIGFTIETVTRLGRGTVAYLVLNVLTSICSIGATISGVWTYNGLVHERRLLVTVSLLFMCYSAFQVSKLIRDENSGIKSTFFYKLFTCLGFAASIGLLFSCVVSVPLTDPQRLFCICGSMWTLASVLSLSKLIRDHQENQEERIGKEEKSDKFHYD